VNSTKYSPYKNDKNIVHQFLSDEVSSLSNNVQEKYSISNRKVLKILNLSLTICFFKNREKILAEDFIEALNLSNVKI
jgi:predicted ATPase with chaperone activity